MTGVLGGPSGSTGDTTRSGSTDEIVITVRGRHSDSRPAERGVLRASVHASGPERQPVMSEVVDSAASVRALLIGAGDSVVSWSTDDVRTWTERPWTQDGRPGDVLFHGRLDMVATLDDVGRLARIMDDAAGIPGVSIDGVDWALTEETNAAVLDEVRWKAVTDAAAKATTYAAAIGRSTIEPVAIADAGMLDGMASGGGVGPIGLMRSVAASDAPGISLTPQPILVEAVVDARFRAS